MAIDFIELNRTFVPISKDHTFDEEVYDLSHIFGLSGTKKWSDLLALPRVVILAEAGAGKTDEVKAAARQLHREGKSSFFFRLEHLVSDFEIAFDETGTLVEFNEWLDGKTPAWFFLDSVDESKLSGPKHFEAAIKRFALKLGDQKHRAHIFITSRISEWKPQSDLSFIKSTLPFTQAIKFTEEEGEKSANPLSQSFTNRTIPANTREPKHVEPEIFALCPLDQDQRKIFSQAYEVPDVNAFLTAVERSEAELFARRPQDLIGLIEYWKQHRKIANRAKLIEHSITSKLTEIDPDRASQLPLKPQDARYGAEMLAAAVTFLRKNRILVPEKNTDPLIKAKSIDIQSVLNWDIKPIRVLLQRPIFDKAVYGCVRFHHRSVREYLTAKWLHHLLINEKSRREVEGLFFKTLYGQRFLIPSMRPILSWLILDDEKIREKAIAISPEICLQGGDPSALAIDLRVHLLEKFCKQYAKQNRWGFSFDLSEVRRFANPCLAETINGLLQTYRDHEEIRELLLRMIWQGGMLSCAETALAFALDDANDIYTRIYGIHAVAAAGAKEQKEELVKTFLNNTTMADKKLTGELISSFAPAYLSTQNILILVERLPPPDKDTIEANPATGLWEYSLQHCPQNQLLSWCKGLLVLLEQPPFIERRYFEVSQKNWWLLSFAVLAVERLVLAKHRDALHSSAIKIISLTQHAVHYDNYYSKEHRFEELVPAWPELNHTLFWFDVASERYRKHRENHGEVTDICHVNILHEYWHFTENDFETILSDIAHKSNLDDRLLALSLAFQVYRKAGRGRVWQQTLKKAVHGIPELEEKLHLLLHPPKISDEVKRSRRSMANYDKRRKQQQKKTVENKKSWRDWLQANTHVLRDTSLASKGEICNGMSYLFRELHEKQNNCDSWAEPHWEALIPEFGQEVAEAYRHGCVNHWRKYTPKTRSEGIENPNSIPHAVIFGLSGIEIEADLVQHWPNNLAEEEVKRACRYALYELSGFPKWLSKLHTGFPITVETLLLKEIAWEFSQYDRKEQCHYVLSKVVYGADWLKPNLAKQILLLLRVYEPKHDNTLSDALGIILGQKGMDPAVFIEISKTKVENTSNHPRQALWLGAWMCVDANGAIEQLKIVLNSIDNAEEATQFSLLFMVALLGNGRTDIQHAYQDFNRPEILLSLIKLMHTYIRTSEDIDRGGTGVFTSGLRDHAQDARNRLVNLLNNIPGKETYLSLLNLSAHFNNKSKKKRYANSAKWRAEADAEDEPWQVEGIIQFAKDAERAPQNHRELFELLVSRLLDLKAELEDGDISNASLLQRVQHENELRNYIAGRLRERSRGWYSVAQEDELPDGKKPDIRINGSGFDAPIPIELKIAEKWSGPKLFERLNKQLCGQYLRDTHSNFGIYLLVYLGQKDQKKKRWKHPKTGEDLDSTTLLESLENEAQDICVRDEKIESLEMIGIDLDKRKCSK